MKNGKIIIPQRRFFCKDGWISFMQFRFTGMSKKVIQVLIRLSGTNHILAPIAHQKLSKPTANSYSI
jgi:hypothetical protein